MRNENTPTDNQQLAAIQQDGMSKDQRPNPKEAPIPKLQQEDAAGRIGILALGFFWELGIGNWEFALPLTTDH